MRGRYVAALVGALLVPGARALAQHGGAPVALLHDQRVGAYTVSVWASPDVGMGRVFVVYDAAPGAAFVAPAAVQVGVTPVDGGLEVVQHAHAERVSHGARFVAHAPFAHEGEWRVRIVTQGVSGALTTQVHAAPAGAHGPISLVLYALPFLAVALLRWRAVTPQRRDPGRASALASL